MNYANIFWTSLHVTFEFPSGFSKQSEGLAPAMLHGWSFWCPTECLCIAWGSWKSKNLDWSLGLFSFCSFKFSRLFKFWTSTNSPQICTCVCQYKCVVCVFSIEKLLPLFLFVFKWMFHSLLTLWWWRLHKSCWLLSMPCPFATSFAWMKLRCSTVSLDIFLLCLCFIHIFVVRYATFICYHVCQNFLPLQQSNW